MYNLTIFSSTSDFLLIGCVCETCAVNNQKKLTQLVLDVSFVRMSDWHLFFFDRLTLCSLVHTKIFIVSIISALERWLSSRLNQFFVAVF